MVKLCTAVCSHGFLYCVVEVCDGCFLSCTSLRIVRFGLSPQLERICAATPYHTGIESFSIPDSVVVLGEKCVNIRRSLLCVTFGESSRLERICVWTFSFTLVESLSIPDNLIELGGMCFRFCRDLRSVIFSGSSNLERICHMACYKTSIESFSIPDSVVELGKKCVFECTSFRRVISGASSSLNVSVGLHSLTPLMSPCLFQTVLLRWVVRAFLVAFILGSLYLVHHFQLNLSLLLFFRRRVSSLFPESVAKLGSECGNLQSIILYALSKLERIGADALSETNIGSFSIPDNVDLRDGCFSECTNHRSVVFSVSSKLERISAEAFKGTSIESLSIPDCAAVL